VAHNGNWIQFSNSQIAAAPGMIPLVRTTV
jgi:hypothetical protein